MFTAVVKAIGSGRFGAEAFDGAAAPVIFSLATKPSLSTSPSHVYHYAL